jgi:ankyrin repeat protein
MLGLVVMIVVSLSNKLLKLPTGLEKSGRTKTAHGAAALFTAILKGRIAVVQSLITQGVNVNVRTISGKTPLMAACFKGYSDIVQLLVDNNADTNAKDSKGDTALKIASRGGYTRIAELLKQAGARTEEAGKSEPPTAPPPPSSHTGPVANRTGIS